MNLIRNTFVVLLTCIALLTNAQDLKTTRDIGIWTALAIEIDWAKKWQGKFNQEFRTSNNALKTERSISEFGLSYDINKEFELEGGLRYSYNRKSNNAFSHNIRYNTDFKFKKKLRKKFHFQYRFRYQSNYENPFSGFSDFRQTDKTRNRIRFDYRRKNHRIYFSTEVFREHVYYKRASFEKLRFTCGDKYKLNKNELHYGLGYEVEVGEDLPLNFFFARIYYTFKL